MRYVKSNRAKLFVYFFTLNCIFLLVMAAKCEAGNKYVVQVAASKTPIDTQHFTNTHNISDTIYVTNNNDSGSLTNEVIVRKESTGNLKSKLLEFGAKNLPENLHEFYFRIIEVLLKNPVIFFFVIFIHFFVINIIGVYVILYFTVRKKNYRERYVKFYSQMYEDILMSYMFGIYNWDTVMIKFKRIKRKLNRRILISILLNFHENLKGEVNILIPEIYVNLGLHRDSLKSARSIFNYKKIQGIRELTYLYPEGALKIIPDLINVTDDSVRSEAQTAFIRLNPDNPFSFFDILVKPFTRWTQISAFNLIRLYQLPVPEFAKYLGSKHFNVRNFSLRMITYFQQLEDVSQIFKMLDSNSEMTRLLSYKAINDLRLYDGKELIKNRFGNETDKNKFEIVKAINNIGLTEDFSFLEKIINSGSVSLKIEACRTMYFMSSEGREKLLQLKENTNPELELYIEHVRDARN